MPSRYVGAVLIALFFSSLAVAQDDRHSHPPAKAILGHWIERREAGDDGAHYYFAADEWIMVDVNGEAHTFKYEVLASDAAQNWLRIKVVDADILKERTFYFASHRKELLDSALVELAEERVFYVNLIWRYADDKTRP